MAEVALGVVSGTFAVASLAIQLMEVAQKMHMFWESIHYATADVEQIKYHLTILQSISSTILESSKRHPQIPCREVVGKSLDCCKCRIERLAKLVQTVSPGKDSNMSKVYWSKLKTSVKRRTILEVEASLRGDVTLLLLTLQPFFHQVQRNDTTLLSADIKQLSAAYTATKTPEDTLQSQKVQSINDQNIQLSPSQQIVQNSRGRHDRRQLTLSAFQTHYSSIEFDSISFLERILLAFGLSPSTSWRKILQYCLVDFSYMSMTRQVYLDTQESFLSDHRIRFKIIAPFAKYHIQTSSLCRQLNVYSILPCQSPIFKLCLDGNISAVKIWFMNRWTSPSVTNQHGENLLHVSAKYAHVELCNLLLDLGVDGAAYDNRLWTPLDHLAHNVCPGFAFPSRVVDTIRALVQRGHCQPLLPVTSNTVSCYRGPEEGFAWLFTSEYAGIDIEERDSEDWTLLGEAAWNFGWWTQLGVDDPATTWQSLYLLRSGADPHTRSAGGRLTPLDAYLRGCTAHQVDHCRKWIQVLLLAGIDLHKYAAVEQASHEPQHLLKTCWDEELWRWIPMKQRVVYEYGEKSDELEIWLEDYDALSWFRGGRFDLEIFQILSASESLLRWTEINDNEDNFEPDDDHSKTGMTVCQSQMSATGVLPGHWLLFLTASLAVNFLFHVYLRIRLAT